MRFWNDWADERWDLVAPALAFTTAVAFAASLVLAFSALVLRPAEREPAAAPSVIVEDARAPRDTHEP